MLFNSAVFVAFLGITLASYWSIQSDRARQWLLVVASLVFYGWWDYRFVPLISYVTVVAYAGALAVQRWPDRRHALVSVAIALQLVQLAFFKYVNFLLENLAALARTMGTSLPVSSSLSIILPIGISFYTFHGISYVVDVYRGKLDRAQSFRIVALYIVFFPQLVAGPIVRADAFIPQLLRRATVDSKSLLVAAKFITIGMIYKGVLADRLAPLVDAIFEKPRVYDNATLVSGALGFYSQIYFDFVGYSTMAIGISRLFGFKLTKNFDFPYRAASITEFWRRWHISLSSWLRDYLYIPLGGNRLGTFKQYRNLIFTMLLGGLWHGASYNFVLWGGLHGVALAIHKLFTTRFPTERAGRWAGPRTVFGWLCTQLFVLAAWVPFRADSFKDTKIFMQALTFQRVDDDLKSAVVPLSLLIVPIVADHVFTYNPRLKRLHWPARPILIAALLGLCFALALPLLQLEVQNFIYFQF